MDADVFKPFLRELAEVSGDVICRWFRRKDFGLEFKADDSPVTLADREAEAIMRDRITKRFPGHGILGEEHGTDRVDAEWVWVLDPIDGTKAFATACPLFGTLIGLLHAGKPVLGCIHQPILRQLMIGDGKTTTLNGEAVRVRTTPTIEEATALLSDFHNGGRFQDGPSHDALLRRVRLARTWGDCYGYLLLSSGWADICLDPIMNAWDVLPLVPVVQGAGGVISDWQGKPCDHLAARSCVAAVPTLHAQVIAALAQSRGIDVLGEPQSR
jgi:myo-inositol-1(or 4)-monophosphatase